MGIFNSKIDKSFDEFFSALIDLTEALKESQQPRAPHYDRIMEEMRRNQIFQDMNARALRAEHENKDLLHIVKKLTEKISNSKEG